MRRMIAQKFVNWIKSLFEKVHQEGNTTEFGGNIEVDGKVKINELSDIVGIDGTQIGKNLEDAVNGESTITITITDDDLVGNSYVKHIEANNVFIKIDFQGTHSEADFTLYCPYFKLYGGYLDYDYIYSFSGSALDPESRYIILTSYALEDTSKRLSIFSGVVCYGIYEL